MGRAAGGCSRPRKVREHPQIEREAILIVGPGNEKTLLLKYLEERRNSATERELRAEACDHPTDREIIALGRRHFLLDEPAR